MKALEKQSVFILLVVLSIASVSAAETEPRHPLSQVSPVDVDFDFYGHEAFNISRVNLDSGLILDGDVIEDSGGNARLKISPGGEGDLFVPNSVLDMGGNRVVNVSAPQDSGDVVNRGYLQDYHADNDDNGTDDQVLGVDGDRITIENGNGVYAPFANNSDRLDGVELSNIDWSDTALVTSDVSGGDVGLGNVLNVNLSKTAGSYIVYDSGSDRFNVQAGIMDWSDLALSQGDVNVSDLGLADSSLDMNGRRILNVPAPQDPGDAVNKSYVDTSDDTVADDQNLEDVLSRGNSAGSYNLDMNGNNIVLNGGYLSNDGGSEGIKVDDAGNVHVPNGKLNLSSDHNLVMDGKGNIHLNDYDNRLRFSDSSGAVYARWDNSAEEVGWFNSTGHDIFGIDKKGFVDVRKIMIGLSGSDHNNYLHPVLEWDDPNSPKGNYSNVSKPAPFLVRPHSGSRSPVATFYPTGSGSNSIIRLGATGGDPSSWTTEIRASGPTTLGGGNVEIPNGDLDMREGTSNRIELDKGDHLEWADPNDQIRVEDHPSWAGTANTMTFKSFGGDFVFRDSNSDRNEVIIQDNGSVEIPNGGLDVSSPSNSDNTVDVGGSMGVEGTLDTNQNEVKNLVVDKRSSDPSSPEVGQIWYRTDLD